MTPMLRREANATFQRVLTRTILLPLVLLALLALVFFFLIYTLLGSTRLVEYSEQVISATNDLESSIFDQETGLRGFLLTNSPPFLEPYTTASGEIDQKFAALADLVKDNPIQVERVASIRALNSQWQDFARNVLTLRENGGSYLSPVVNGEGKQRVDAMRVLVDQMRATEEGVQRERTNSARQTTAFVLAASILSALALGAALTLATRRTMVRLSDTYNTALHSAEQNEQELFNQRELFRSTLLSIGDAVIATDARGMVSFMNPVAETLTGWTTDEAQGKPIGDVFNIVHEETHEPAEVPITRVLNEGIVMGLANHTALVRRDGTNMPIDDSAAPVRDANGVLVGAVLVFRDISERYRAEQELRASERRYRDLAEAMPLSIYTADPNGKVDYYNSHWLSYTGITMDDVRAGRVQGIIHPDDLPAATERWRSALASGTTYEFEYRRRRADGAYRWQLGRAMPVRDANDTITQWIGTAVDIDDQKRSEQELRASERRYRELAEAMPVLVFTADPTGNIDYYNQRWLAYTGADLEQVAGWNWQPYIHPDDLPTVVERWQHALQTGEPLFVEFRFKRHDGVFRWQLANAIPLRDADGTIIQWIGTDTDIDDNKRFSEQIEASERRYRDLAESMDMLVWTALPNGDVDYFNQHWVAYTGLNPADSMSWNWGPAIHPDDLDSVVAGWTHALQTGERFSHELRLRAADGRYRWYLSQANLRYDDHNQPIKWYGSAIDIDDQKRAEQELRESEAEFRQITESMPQLVWTTLPDGYHVYFNQRWYDYTGTTLEQTRGEGWSSFLHPDDYDRTLAAWHYSLETGEPYDIEYRFKEAATGEYRWFLGRAAAIRDAAGRISEWFGTCTEIESQKQAEQNLLARTQELSRITATLEERNRELDQFAYVTSHDLKAPLRGIANLSQWIEEDLGANATAEIRKQLELLRGRVHRMEGLIDGILQYSRIGRVKNTIEKVDVNELVADVVDLLAAPDNVTISVEPGLPRLNTERLYVQQVFQNLIGNAIKHGGGRPDLRIGVRCTDAGTFYQFTVSDNGPGIAPQYHDKVFVMFQTLASRDKVEGTGLGLSLVKKIVELHGGRVWLESSEGSGAAFHFTWPKRA